MKQKKLIQNKDELFHFPPVPLIFMLHFIPNALHLFFKSPSKRKTHKLCNTENSTQAYKSPFFRWPRLSAEAVQAPSLDIFQKPTRHSPELWVPLPELIPRGTCWHHPLCGLLFHCKFIGKCAQPT